MWSLETKVSHISKIGKALISRLKYIEIETVRDLIFYLPFRYENYQHLPIDKLRLGDYANICGTVEMINSKRTRFKRKALVEALISDDSGTIKLLWFNQPWVVKNIKVGQRLCVSGKVAGSDFDLYLSSPSYSQNESSQKIGILPIYHLTAGVTQKQLRTLLKICLDQIDIKEYLPKEIILAEKYLSLPSALKEAHFPSSDINTEKARQRLSFDELFFMQFASQLYKKQISALKSDSIKFDELLIKKFVNSLSFDLTIDQKKSAWEIIQDLQKTTPMNRMLEGDVGSGKTIVAFMAIFTVANNSKQSVIMTPTEILATQHYQSALKLFGKKINIALLCRAQKYFNGEKISESDLLAKIEKGEADLTIGTHALIQNKVKFKKLALVIIDEQHRFGVEQRQQLKQKAKSSPHFLSLTATPIPRSLALIIYGDLDVSIIRQMPKGRKPIITKVVAPEKRKLAYDFIKKQIGEGRQIFVICPLIDPSDILGFKSVKEEFERLDKEIFPNISVGLLHGKMKSDEKEEVMKKFMENKIKILVSTSVIEVGIDVPNASVMMIEGAERFGLAQLHQFRGRVGRGESQSYCFLFSEADDENILKRLKYLESCNDGFELANFDLELRGSGSVLSTQQSGRMDLKIADIKDLSTTKKAQDWAKWCIERGDEKLIDALRQKMGEMGFTSHRE
ncbi:MAG: ATP-dependent DNA helicase RecG [Candidatus Buchananbacteria bacterium]